MGRVALPTRVPRPVAEGLGLPLDRFEVGYVPVVPSPALRLLDESPTTDAGRSARSIPARATSAPS